MAATSWCVSVIRRRSNVQEELTVSAEDHAAGVRRQAWVRLGNDPPGRAQRCGRVRVVWVETPDRWDTPSGDQFGPPHFKRRTRQLVSTAVAGRSNAFSAGSNACPAAGIGWPKARPGSATNWRERAAVLLQQVIGRRPNQRMFELIQLYPIRCRDTGRA